MLQCIHKVTFDDRPTSHIEDVREAVSPSRLIEGHSFDGLEHLLFREQFFQMREVKGGKSSMSRLIEASRAGADPIDPHSIRPPLRLCYLVPCISHHCDVKK